MNDQELTTMKSLDELVEEAMPDMMAIPQDEQVSPRLGRDPAEVCTNTTKGNAEKKFDKAEEALSESFCNSLRVCLDKLPAAVKVYYATDLLFENMGKENYSHQRKELADKIHGYNLKLYNWAWALYSDDEKISPVLIAVKKGHGYRNDGGDVVVITKILKDNWDYVEGKIPLTFEYIDRASKEAAQFLDLLNKIEEKGEAQKKARELRRRAYTIWVKMYNQVRRTYRFVLWEEKNFSKLFPSPSPLRSRRKKKTTPKTQPSVEIIE